LLYVWFADTFVFGQDKDKENVRRMQDGTCAYVTYIEETNAGRQAERNVKKRNFFSRRAESPAAGGGAASVNLLTPKSFRLL
jgi:hypothetical protein